MLDGSAGANCQAGVQLLLALLPPFVSNRVAAVLCPSF
jgi:hypothetical protein